MAISPDSTPAAVAAALREAGTADAPAWLVREDAGRGYRSSHPSLAPLAEWLAHGAADAAGHEAVFLGVGPESGALFAAVVHDTRRGQAQGGVRRYAYTTVEALLRDGLRLARGMTRKNALAHLWWGGGKGLIAEAPGRDGDEDDYRRTLYREYGRFVSQLRGCYITAEDVGTLPSDMRSIAEATRFVTCIPEEMGGRGNPSPMTAAGVACAIDAALAFTRDTTPAGLRFVVQGGGNVGSALVTELLARDAAQVLVGEASRDRCDALRNAFDGRPVEVRHTPPDDRSLLASECDVLAPCALGGVLDAKQIPELRTRIVVGSANNPLGDEVADAARLDERGITFVPDFVANRMGIVFVSNEQYGRVQDDPDVVRHLSREWEGGVYATTLRVLETARDTKTTPQLAALRLADELAEQEHPLFGHRSWKIIQGLCG